MTTSRLATKLGLKTAELTEKLVRLEHLELKGGKPYLTEKGKRAGGEWRKSSKFGSYFLWPDGMKVDDL